MLRVNDKSSFFMDKEWDITSQYLKQGYYIAPVADKAALSWMHKSFLRIVREELNISVEDKEDQLLDLIHQKIPISELNNFRLNASGI